MFLWIDVFSDLLKYYELKLTGTYVIKFLHVFIILKSWRYPSGCRGLVIGSSLPKIFSAGLEITEMYQPDEARLREFWRTLQEFWIKLYGSQMITIAAITVSDYCLLFCIWESSVGLYVCCVWSSSSSSSSKYWQTGNCVLHVTYWWINLFSVYHKYFLSCTVLCKLYTHTYIWWVWNTFRDTHLLEVVSSACVVTTEWWQTASLLLVWTRHF